MDFSDRLVVSEKLIESLLNNPNQLGIDAIDLVDKTPAQQRAFVIGEYLAALTVESGKKAVDNLRTSGHARPDWFDHRLHLLVPEEEFLDFWTASGDNVVFKLPMGGKVLDLCSGDGFYDYWVFRRRASEVVCVDISERAHRQAVRLHSAPNVRHYKLNILTWDPTPKYYDVVVCRGAIEHFSQENQQVIFRKALSALRPGGWFCGDTPANKKSANKMLGAHENEWENEVEMRAELEKVFPIVHTSVLVSTQRTTLFWQAQTP
jgi:SAM-dependent methyltransferase